MTASATPIPSSRRMRRRLLCLAVVGLLIFAAGKGSARFRREQALMWGVLDPAVDELKVRVGSESLQRIIADAAWLAILGDELQGYVQHPETLVNEGGSSRGFPHGTSGLLFFVDAQLRTMPSLVPGARDHEPPAETLDLRVMASIERTRLVFWGAPDVRLAVESASLPADEVATIRADLVQRIGVAGLQTSDGPPNLER